MFKGARSYTYPSKGRQPPWPYSGPICTRKDAVKVHGFFNTVNMSIIMLNVSDQGVSVVLLNHQWRPRVTLASVFSCTGHNDFNPPLMIFLHDFILWWFSDPFPKYYMSMQKLDFCRNWVTFSSLAFPSGSTGHLVIISKFQEQECILKIIS